jgi:hypothetical protein
MALAAEDVLGGPRAEAAAGSARNPWVAAMRAAPVAWQRPGVELP